MSTITELIERHPELKFQVQVIGLIRDYQSNLDGLNSVLVKYGVKAVDEIEGKIGRGELAEHPCYEDYLEALSHRENVREAVREIRRIVDALEAGVG